MKTKRLLSLFAIALTVGFTILAVVPDDAEAKRFGGGSSIGSRGSRSFSTARQPTTRTATPQTQTNTAGARQQNGMGATSSGFGSRFGSGLMGGIGGMLLGGMIGSMLFGGGGGMGMGGGGGIGILEILLIGGGIFLLFRYLKRKKREQESAPMATVGSSSYGRDMNSGPMSFPAQGDHDDLPDSFEPGGGGGVPFNQPLDEVSQGLEHIMQMDPSFREDQFLDGAKACFEQIQGAWSDWSVDRLRPLLTDRMWGMIEAQSAERKAAGIRDIIEKIQFNNAEISEAWQESGENWITVRFQVSLIEYSADVEGKLLEGSTDVPVDVEEFWTFTRPITAKNPNWFLSAIQQPGEVAKSVS